MPKPKLKVIDATEVTELTVTDRASVALNSAEHEKKLLLMAQSSKDITEITNPASYQECHSARMALKNMRVDIQKVGKAAREDATAFSKAVIAEENRLIGLIQPEETRLDKIQSEHDEAKERERQAKIEAERQRVQAIQDRIQAIRNMATALTGKSAADIAAIGAQVGAIEITEGDYAELVQSATDAKNATLATLRAAYVERNEFEQEQIRIKAEREQLERDRAEQVERDRIERERLAELDRVAREERAAEQAKIDEANRIEREALAAEREAQRQQAEEDRRKRNELQAQIDSHRAEMARLAEEQRKANEPKPEAVGVADLMQPEPAKTGAQMVADLIARKEPSFDEIVTVLSDHFDVNEDDVRTWIQPA